MIKAIRYSVFALHIFFGVYALVFHNFEVAVLCVTLLWINNMIFSIEKWKNRFLFCVFHCMLFMFLIARPVISIYKGYKWKYYTDESMTFAFFSLWLTMIFMLVGCIMYESYIQAKLKSSAHEVIHTKSNVEFQKCLQITALLVYFFSMLAYLYLQFEKVNFMRGKMYYEFFVNFTSQAPYIIHLIASFRTYSLGIFLATRPKKKITFVVLLCTLMSDGLGLVFGKRSLVMLDIIFIVIYYLMRQGMSEEEKWVGRYEKMGACIGAPIIVLAMGAINYLRDGSKVSIGLIDLLLDFFYKQGVSFNVLNLGYQSIPFLPDRPFRNYTFGGIIDYFTHGSLAQKLFGATAFEEGNNLQWALESNSFAHNMSYIMEDGYLEGHGLGSSYLLETFVDYGYIGIIVFSLILGMLLIWFVHAMQKMNFLSTIILIIIPNLFFMPRGEATGAITFLFYKQFWAVVLLCYAGAVVFQRIFFDDRIRWRMKRKMKKDFGIKDVISGLFRYKFHITCVVVFFALLGVVFSGQKTEEGILTEYQSSQTFYFSYDIDEEDTHTKPANVVSALLEEKFCKFYVVDQLLEVYSEDELSKLFGLSNQEEDKFAEKIGEKVTATVLAEGDVLSLSIQTDNEELTKAIASAYKGFIESLEKLLVTTKVISFDSTFEKINITVETRAKIGYIAMFSIFGLIMSCIVVFFVSLLKPTINGKDDFNEFDVVVLGEIREK